REAGRKEGALCFLEPFPLIIVLSDTRRGVILEKEIGLAFGDSSLKRRLCGHFQELRRGSQSTTAWVRMTPSKDGRTVKAVHCCGRERWLKVEKEDPPCECQPCATRLLSIEPVEFEEGDKGWLAKFHVPDLTTGAGQLRIAWARYLGMPMKEVY